jgi:hypothetical protein
MNFDCRSGSQSALSILCALATGLAIQGNSADAATMIRVSVDSNGNESNGFNPTSATHHQIP